MIRHPGPELIRWVGDERVEPGLDLHPPAGATPGERRAAAALLGAWLAELLAHRPWTVEQLDADGVPSRWCSTG